jgi:hypothetical protein
MTERERFLAVYQFRGFDRCPMWEMGMWQATLDRWRHEGWDGREDFAVTYRHDGRENAGLDFAMLPRFERRVLEDDGRVRLLVDERGVTCRELVERTETSMPHWLDFPVKDRASWEAMKARYDPHDPRRYPADWEERKQQWARRDHPLQVYGGRDTGFFGPVRGWMGAENAMLCFYDDPDLMHEMMEFLADFTIEVMRRCLKEVEIDYFVFWEDMAFKTASLISPGMFREFMLPRYRKVSDFAHSQGVPITMMDSDGYIDELVPLWIEGGVDVIYPFEVAAGEDVVALRKQYPRLGMNGGIDKRALAKDRAAIDAELARVMPLIETGGYVPTIDHGPPPDIPLDNFRYYMDRKWEWIERIGGTL